MVLLSEIVQTFILADFWCAALLRLCDLLCSLNDAANGSTLVRRSLGKFAAAALPCLRLGAVVNQQYHHACRLPSWGLDGVEHGDCPDNNYLVVQLVLYQVVRRGYR